ncbi:peroxiredoxin family protein [uncultured Croceitalea sp.]|uniref:peroxiredoxin family protein n=1 Tax=uncultured Croceitalea sp. TaxID=1798908 RepID=UPI00374F66ED
MSGLEQHKKLPEWSLESLFDEKVPLLKDFRGKPLLILFFYMGCPGCKGRAIPYANRLVYEKTNINVVGIHTRFEGRTYSDEELRSAKDEFHIRFPYYRDVHPATTFTLYEAGGTPHWILLDKDGNIVQSIFGSDPNKALLRIDLKINELNQVDIKE